MTDNREAEESGQQTGRGRSSLFRWLVYLQLLALFLILYVKLGGVLILQTNNTAKDLSTGNQLKSLHLAMEVRKDFEPEFEKGFSKAVFKLFPHQTDGVSQPLWPWMAAWLSDPTDPSPSVGLAPAEGVSDQERTLFNQGRWVLVYFTAAFLGLLALVVGRFFSLPAALNLLLLAGLGALLPRTAYFQPEPVYYVFFFLTWIACVCTLVNNSLWMYGLIGALSGIAYMAKASVQPLLAVFIFITALRCVWDFFASRKRSFASANVCLWQGRNHFVGLVILLLTHFMFIGPRLTHAYEKFGSMFHSYPAYWAWFDTYGGPSTAMDTKTVYGWMEWHQTKQELQAMSVTEKPSLTNYLRTHSQDQVWNRLRDGTKAVIRDFLWPRQTFMSTEVQKPWKGILEWRGVYLVYLGGIFFFLLIAMTFAVPKALHAGHTIFRHGTLTIFFFSVTTFVVYALIYGWYVPIFRGDRFLMALYLPMVFSFIWSSETIVRRLRRRQCSVWIPRLYFTSQWLLLGALCWRLTEIIRFPQFSNG